MLIYRRQEHFICIEYWYIKIEQNLLATDTGRNIKVGNSMAQVDKQDNLMLHVRRRY